jgi:uncharacterized protein YlxW (UPF0749 family)
MTEDHQPGPAVPQPGETAPGGTGPAPTAPAETDPRETGPGETGAETGGAETGPARPAAETAAGTTPGAAPEGGAGGSAGPPPRDVADPPVPAPEAPAPAPPPPAGAPPPPVRRRRVSAAGAIIGLLLGLLGFAFVVQLRSNSTDQQLSADRPEDLVRILSDLDARKDRLSQEIATLQTTQEQLAAGSQSRQAALAEASRRADELGILAGSLPAQGPGLRVEFRSAAKPILARDLLNAVEELRGAGAEAMQLSGGNGPVIRVVASSSFVDGPGGALTVDGQTMTGPYLLTVIGDPQTMQIALNIPSGVVETVHNDGGNVTITAATTVQVSALHAGTTPRYAQPAG